MTTNHTPGPWYATDEHVQSASINEDNYVCRAEGDTQAQAEANAAFIVRACNAHDELVAALDELASYVPEYDRDTIGYKIVQRARAAIARAKGQ